MLRIQSTGKFHSQVYRLWAVAVETWDLRLETLQEIEDDGKIQEKRRKGEAR